MTKTEAHEITCFADIPAGYDVDELLNDLYEAYNGQQLKDEEKKKTKKLYNEIALNVNRQRNRKVYIMIR